MGPLSHTYVSMKVTERKNSMLIFGSILPDIAWLSDEHIWKNKLHNNPSGFYSFVRRNYPQLIELALGVRLHCFTNRGADYYSDDERIGYAKIEAHWYTKSVKKLLQLEQKGIDIPLKNFTINSNTWFCRIFHANDIIAHILAHSVVECGVDINLLLNHRDVVACYTLACSKVNILPIQHCLAQYLQMDENEVRHQLNTYMNFLNPPGGLSSVKRIIDTEVIPVLEHRLKRKFDPTEVERLLHVAQKRTKSQYLLFLNTAVSAMKHDFQNLI